MTPREERAALQEKVEEIKKVTAEMDARFHRLPFNQETAQMREMMVKLLEELHRMERNIDALLQLESADEQISEGGTENGR